MNIASGDTGVFKISNSSRTVLVFITSTIASSGYALIAHGSAANTVIAKGSSFEVGDTTNPGTGTFRVWTSATNELSIENTNASSRVLGVYSMEI